MQKARGAFRTISEVAESLDTQPHVLRFWESKFSQVKPVKRAGGRRYYRPADVELLSGIKKLLHEDGLTIKGVQKVLKDRGVKYVAALSAGAEGPADDIEDAVVVPMERKAVPATNEAEMFAEAASETAENRREIKSMRAKLKATSGTEKAQIAALYARIEALHSRLAAPSGGF